jgi:peptidase A4-like protein
MTAKRVIPTLAASVACALGAVPAASASTDVQTAASANWAGYVVGGSSSATRYRSVSGSWVAPTAKCSSGQGFSSFWVGLGGSGSGSGSGSGDTEALEQAGTEADCNTDGSATYSAWYELVPSPPIKIGMAVHPGDHITSKVTVDGTNVTINLTNSTTGGSFTKTLQMSNPDTSSAEWIAEAPSTCNQGVSDCTPLSLADFGTVQFSGAGATTTDGHTGTISDSAWSTAAVQLSPSASQLGFGDAQFASYQGSAGATPSSLSSDGSSFSVAYSADSSGSGSGSGSVSGSAGPGDPTGGYGYGSGGSDGYGGYSGGYGGWGGYGSYGGYGSDGGWGGYGYAYVPGAYSY